MKVTVGGAQIQTEQWLQYQTVEELAIALLEVGIILDPQKVWDALEPYRT